MPNLKIVTRDITTLDVDAIVNAANPTLLGGGGVDGAIHRAAGPRLKMACEKIIKDNNYSKGAPVGSAFITPGFNLLADNVIHAVGPIYNRHEDPHTILEDTYNNSFQIAEENSLSSIAFPGISTGIYGFPKDEAAEVVLDVLEDFKFKNIEDIILTYVSHSDTKLAQDIIGEPKFR